MFDSHRQFKLGTAERIAAIDNDIKKLKNLRKVLLIGIVIAGAVFTSLPFVLTTITR